MRIGIDLGGTKTEIIALDSDGQERWRERVPTPGDNYDGIIRTIADLVTATERRLGTDARVGVGIPGAPSRQTGLIKNANTVCLIGRPLQADLSRLLNREVRLANDANCFALSEATDGAAAGAPVVFGVIIGTGTGGGVVIDGHVLPGLNAIAGEWGHNSLPWPDADELPGTKCYCGKFGCIETFLSGPALSADHQRHTGEKISAQEIAAKLPQNLPAQATLARYERRLAKALASVINVIDPDVVVLGGGVSNISTLYETVPRIWQSYAFSDQITTRLVRAVHGDSSGVRGAAWLWPRKSEGAQS